MVRYYDVAADDCAFADRWFLGEPISEHGDEIDAREFRYGRHYCGDAPAHMPVDQNGKPVRFNLAAFDMPVVSVEVADAIMRIAPNEVECFPVCVGPYAAQYVILNALCRERCVDESRSDVTFWTPNDGRPDKVGRYRMVSDLCIDPLRANNRDIFRIEDFEVALIVSDRIKEALENCPDLGVVFEPVC